MRAPQNGVVIYANAHVGWIANTPLAPGKAMWPGMPLIVLPDTSQMTMNLRVNGGANPNRQGRSGSRCHHQRPARPPVFRKRHPKGGHGRERPYQPFLSEYRVKVELPKGIDNDLKPGMSCRGTIATGEVKDALTLPVQAVFTDKSAHHCFVDVGGGKVARRAIETGQASALYTAITDGLKPGERVLLRAPSPEEIAK